MQQSQYHSHSNGKDTGAAEFQNGGTATTAPQIVHVKVCDSCPRLEADIKKLKSEVFSMKQVENDLRQKVDSSATLKSCLQAKQKENDELQHK